MDNLVKKKFHPLSNSFLLTQKILKNSDSIRLGEFEVDLFHVGFASFLRENASVIVEPGPHRHEDFLEFHLVVSGRGSVSMNKGSWMPLTRGGLYWALPGEYHQNQLLDRKNGYEMLFYGLRFTRENRSVTVADFCRHFNFPPARIAHNCHDLLDVLMRLERELTHNQLFSKQLCNHYVREFLLLSFQKMSAAPITFPQTSEYALVSELHQMINQDLCHAWTLEELARKSGYSPRHLSRIWRNITGFSPMDFILRCRLEHARKLLSRTDLNIMEISRDSGFSTKQYFCRSFKKVTQLTPNYYRRNFPSLSSNLLWR